MDKNVFDLSPTNCGAFAVAGLLSWYLVSAAVAWYRLRHIPGPFLASFSYLWLAKVARSARQYYVYRDLCKQYGPLVRVGPNELTTDNPEVLRRMAAARGSYGRDVWYQGAKFNPYHDAIFTLMEQSAHQERKSKIVGGLAGREAPLLESGVDSQVQNLIKVIRENYLWDVSRNQNKLLDLAPLTSYFTLDVISKVVFGEEFGYLKANADLYDFVREVRENWPRLAMAVDVPWVRNILFSNLFLRWFGPTEADDKGMGRCMG